MNGGDLILMTILTWCGRIAGGWLFLIYADPWVMALIGKL